MKGSRRVLPLLAATLLLAACGDQVTNPRSAPVRAGFDTVSSDSTDRSGHTIGSNSMDGDSTAVE